MCSRPIKHRRISEQLHFGNKCFGLMAITYKPDPCQYCGRESMVWTYIMRIQKGASEQDNFNRSAKDRKTVIIEELIGIKSTKS